MGIISTETSQEERREKIMIANGVSEILYLLSLLHNKPLQNFMAKVDNKHLYSFCGNHRIVLRLLRSVNSNVPKKKKKTHHQ